MALLVSEDEIIWVECPKKKHLRNDKREFHKTKHILNKI